MADTPSEAEETSVDNIGALESAGRGAAQMFSLGYSPQLIAALKTRRSPLSSDPLYLAELAKQKAATEKAWEERPYSYGAGAAASFLPAVLGAVASAPASVPAAATALAARAAAPAVAKQAPGLLASTSNLASLTGAGLRKLVGESTGALPSAARATAAKLESPIVQGAVFGSSIGEDLSDKATGAAAGALGAKYLPAILGKTGEYIADFGAKAAPALKSLTEPLSYVLTGATEKAAAARDLASKLGVSLPAAVIDQSLAPKALTKLDPTQRLPAAAYSTLSEIGSRISELAGQATPVDAGYAVKQAAKTWLLDKEVPAGFNATMERVYAPLRYLQDSSSSFGLNNFSKELGNLLSAPRGRVNEEVANTIQGVLKNNYVVDALQSGRGLTFPELRAFRQALSDKIDYGRLPGQTPVDEATLRALRNAVTSDMRSAAYQFGKDAYLKAFDKAEKEATSLYNLRGRVLSVVGSPFAVATEKGAAEGAIYNKLVNSLFQQTKGAGWQTAKELKDVIRSVSPEAWEDVQKAFIKTRLTPNEQFSFNNFNKIYNRELHPQGKEILFDKTGSARRFLEDLNAFGKVATKEGALGQSLDRLARGAASSQRDIFGKLGGVGAVEAGAAILENAFLGGLPLNTILAAGTGVVSGKLASQDIAREASKYDPSFLAKVGREFVEKSTAAVGGTYGSKGLQIPVGLAGMKVMESVNSLPDWVWGTLIVGLQKTLPESITTPSSAPTVAPVQKEGSLKETPPAVRWNNPGNIESGTFAKSQPGYAGTDATGRFAKFATLEQGNAAADNLLASYGRRGFDTPMRIAERWSPASENGARIRDQKAAMIASALGVGMNDRLDMTSKENLEKVRKAIAKSEGNYADGGRIERKAGGRVDSRIAAKASMLVQAADRAKKALGSRTEALLDEHDDTITKALAMANQAI